MVSNLIQKIFKIKSESDFLETSLGVYAYQFANNPIYQLFSKSLGRTPENTVELNQIPFVPISFFKTQKMLSSSQESQITFSSSGTSGQQNSMHYVTDLEVYKKSFLTAFEHFYGSCEDYIVFALLPNYLERGGSSLVYMVDAIIKNSQHPLSGFFLHEHELLHQNLLTAAASGKKILLVGVSFALLDFVEKYNLNIPELVVMETGGMKGQRKEIVRQELHQILKSGFGVPKIHSEYGMTELLSQAYSKGDGLFYTPAWMKVLIRDVNDPFAFVESGKTGGINIIDLANINSCSFIATQDLGKQYLDSSFELIGRFDDSDLRGCNLMVL